MRFTLDELSAALSGTVHGPGATVVDGLSIDSRSLAPGQLFAAVRAERDGHDFVAAARAAGAPAVLVERLDRPAGDSAEGGGAMPGPSLVVPDVGSALRDLARLARSRVDGPVVGITGSVGKTTCKDLLAASLGTTVRTAASERSFNNELGVPITLANAPDDVEAVVVEMGARGMGHIALLCSMASPTVGIVTTVAAVHTELMGGVEQIAVAKGELVESLPADGVAVLNADNPLVAAMASRATSEVVTFGAAGDVRAEGVTVDDELRAAFTLVSPWGSADVRLGLRGEHNVANALAAACAALWIGVDLEDLAAGLAVADGSPWRMDLRRTASGARVLNDAYNAGPASMAAALRSLATLDATRRIAVVGLMAELGDDAPAEHRRIAELADELGVELVAVGTDLYGVDAVPDADAALAALGGAEGLGSDTAVLVKGSRVAGLERVAEALTDSAATS